jgi:antitoxin PrlF
MHLRSKVSRDGRIVVPRAVGKRLNLRPGDYVHFILEPKAVRLFKAPAQDANNPFALFSEWASKADEEAYADL